MMNYRKYLQIASMIVALVLLGAPTVDADEFADAIARAQSRTVKILYFLIG